jgi:Bacteriocin-protection, YdeI or OmpD-Associated/Domain of unknown function (DUF1905)
MATTSKPQRFLARIYKIWMMRHVTVPEEVSSALAKELATRGKGATNAKPKTKQSAKLERHTKPKYIPVVAIVNGRISRTTLVPAGDGCHRLQINTILRKAAHADVGDIVSVELRLDLESRELPVPADLVAALKEHPKARGAFEALAAGHRRQFIKWFDSAKAPETRIRRLTRAMDILLERAILGPSRRPAKRAPR